VLVSWFFWGFFFFFLESFFGGGGGGLGLARGGSWDEAVSVSFGVGFFFFLAGWRGCWGRVGGCWFCFGVFFSFLGLPGVVCGQVLFLGVCFFFFFFVGVVVGAVGRLWGLVGVFGGGGLGWGAGGGDGPGAYFPLSKRPSFFPEMFVISSTLPSADGLLLSPCKRAHPLSRFAGFVLLVFLVFPV